MSWIDRSTWFVRAVGQASAYVALVLAVIELLRREHVITHQALTPGTVLLILCAWVVLVVYRAWQEWRS